MNPKYARPTKSTQLYTYTNRDQDLIKQGFRAGNFTFLARIPKKITPFGVSAALREHSKRNITEKPRSVSVKRPSLQYEWMPDSYNLKRDFLKKVRQDSLKKRKSISKRDFICSGTPDKMRSRESTPNSYVGINTSFSAMQDQASRLKWIKDIQIKHGNFNTGRSLVTYQNKSTAQEIITSLKRKISSDWNETNFDIGLNNTNSIELRFYMKSVENLESMNHYMNVLINKNQDISKFCLRKVPNTWGMKMGKFLVYILAPAWVRLPISQLTHSFDISRGSRSPLRTRGNSVNYCK